MDSSINIKTSNNKIQEWMSLSHIIKLIPSKLRRGLLIQDVNFTCIDCANEYIAVGTNVGMVYWCNRKTFKVKQLKPQIGDLAITCVKLVDSIDYMLAVGDKSGIVSIFKIPKELPQDLPEEFLMRYDNKIEVYTVGGLHKIQITSLEWSLNGEKLFSGDRDGVVCYTQMDFYMNMTKSCEILNEKCRIVQLSFNNNQHLIVSTICRSIIVNKNEDWKISQIGQKDRKTLMELGAVFNTKSCTSGSTPLIYAARNGQRIWISDISGVVKSTLLFKEVLSKKDIPKIKSPEDYERIGFVNCSKFEFGTFHMLRDSLLVSYSSNLLVLIDPVTTSIVGALRSYNNINCIATTKDELFIIEGNRDIRRFSFSPDQFGIPKPGHIFETESPLAETIIDLATSKIRDAAIVIGPLLKDYAEATPVTQVNSPEVDYDVGIAVEMETSEDSTTTNIVTDLNDLPSTSKPSPRNSITSLNSVNNYEKVTVPNEKDQRRNILNEIGNQEYSDVIFSTTSRKNRKSSKPNKKKYIVDNSKITSNGSGNGGADHDSDSTSTKSEIESISVMTTSHTSSDFEFSKVDSNGVTAAMVEITSTNEELESQVAKMLSLEDVLLNPPPLKPTPLPNEEEVNSSRVKHNFLDYALSNSSSTSDIGTEDSKNIQSVKELNDENENTENENGIYLEQPGTVALNFNLDHFGKSGDKSNSSFESKSEISEQAQTCDIVKVCDSKLLKEDNIGHNSSLIEDVVDCSQIRYTEDESIENEHFGDKNEAPKDDKNVCDKTIVKTELCSSQNLPDLLTSVDNSLLGDVNSEENTKDVMTSSDFDIFYNKAINDQSKLKSYISTLKDGWHCCVTPHTCVWFTASDHRLYCGGPRLSMYKVDLMEETLDWSLIQQKASCLHVSPSNKFLWKSNLGVVSTYIPNSNEDWVVCARDVDSFSLTDKVVWYVSQGKVYLQNLPKSDPVLIPCALYIIKVVCYRFKTWILSEQGQILCRDNISENNVKGDSWKKVKTPPHIKISDIALTRRNIGWIVDRNNDIYFNPNNSTEWWQLFIHGNFKHESLHTQSAQKLCIASNASSIWISHPLANAVYVNQSTFYGHQWIPMIFKDLEIQPKFKKISAEGLFENVGYIWFLTSQGEIYNYSPYHDKCCVVPSPLEDNTDDYIVSIEAGPNALWVLTEKGTIYIRLGISIEYCSGLSWKTLNLEQLSCHNIKIQDLSCGSDIVWACSKKGEMYMCVCSPHQEREQIPAWILVDGNALPNCHFTKVFTGIDGSMVWTIDNKNNVYVREGIFHDFQLGINWLFVPGIQASSITISNSSVSALSFDSCVYKRIGVSQNNFIGDYWQQVPEHLSVLSTSLDDNLYGVSSVSGTLLKHKSLELHIDLEDDLEELVNDSKRAGEWELLSEGDLS